MKKLMIAAAIVCAAAFAQAASVTWGFGGKVYASEDGSTSVVANAYTGTVPTGAQLVLLYVGQSQTSFSLGEKGTLLTGQAVVDTIDWGIKTSGKASQVGKWDPATQSADLSGYSNNASFAVVFYDGNAYDYVYAVDTSDGTVGAAYKTATVYADLSGQTALDTLYGTGGSSTAGAVNVPEPTSGLMLLLGMAGLALRRKQK